MNDNSKIHNVKYGIDYAGPHTVMHHQCCQMVDLVTQCCRRTMCGLNPSALPHAPSQHQEIEKRGK